MALKNHKKIIIGIITLLVVIIILIINNKRTNISQCPEWQNCMPGPGRGDKCEVPKGCEGITQIAW